MKKLFVLFIGAAMLLITSCSRERDRNINLRSGEPVKVEKNLDPDTAYDKKSEIKEYVIRRNDDAIIIDD
jgi:hypothetical protein